MTALIFCKSICNSPSAKKPWESHSTWTTHCTSASMSITSTKSRTKTSSIDSRTLLVRNNSLWSKWCGPFNEESPRKIEPTVWEPTRKVHSSPGYACPVCECLLRDHLLIFSSVLLDSRCDSVYWQRGRRLVDQVQICGFPRPGGGARK